MDGFWERIRGFLLLGRKAYFQGLCYCSGTLLQSRSRVCFQRFLDFLFTLKLVEMMQFNRMNMFQKGSFNCHLDRVVILVVQPLRNSFARCFCLEMLVFGLGGLGEWHNCQRRKLCMDGCKRLSHRNHGQTLDMFDLTRHFSPPLLRAKVGDLMYSLLMSKQSTSTKQLRLLGVLCVF